MGHWGRLRYIYMASASDQGYEYVNQFYVSFGLSDPYCDKVLWRYIGTCHINGLLNPKLNADPLGHTKTITADLPHCPSPSLSKGLTILLPLCSG